MKLTTDRKALADTLAWVTRVLATSPNTPVLGGVRLLAQDGHLTASAFDYEASHSARIAVEVADDGECLVSGAFLRAITAAMAGKQVTLQLDGDSLTIASGRSTYRAQTLALADYPSLPPVPAPSGHTDGAAFSAAVLAVLGASDDEAPTVNIRGVRLEATDALDVIALDGKLLVHRSTPWDGDELAATTPGRSIAKAVSGLTGELTIGVSANAVSLADAERIVVLRVIDEPYVKWRVATRENADDRFSVVADRDELIGATKRAALLTKGDKDPRPVSLAIDKDSIEIAATDGTAGGSEVVDAEGDGRELIPVNPQYLLQALGAMESGPVRIGIAERRSHDMGGLLTVRPAREDDQDGREASFAPRRGGEVR